MDALVTGGTGFVGANLVRELLSDGHTVRVLARKGGDRTALEGCAVEIAEGDLTQPRADLATFEDRFGLPHVAWNQIQVGAPSSDTAGADEWDLDTQYSTGFAPNVSGLRVYAGVSLSNTDIANEVNQWVTDNATKQASFSAGDDCCRIRKRRRQAGIRDEDDGRLFRHLGQPDPAVGSGRRRLLCQRGSGRAGGQGRSR